MKRAIVLLAVLTGCGVSDPCPVEPQVVSELGIGFYADPECPEWTRAPDLPVRLDAVARVVAQHVDADPADLRGYVVVFRATDRVPCEDTAEAFGCAHAADRWIEATCIDAGCAEASILAHELLHAWLFDPEHTDPRWATLWSAVYAAFQLPDGTMCN